MLSAHTRCWPIIIIRNGIRISQEQVTVINAYSVDQRGVLHLDLRETPHPIDEMMGTALTAPKPFALSISIPEVANIIHRPPVVHGVARRGEPHPLHHVSVVHLDVGDAFVIVLCLEALDRATSAAVVSSRCSRMEPNLDGIHFAAAAHTDFGDIVIAARPRQDIIVISAATANPATPLAVRDILRKVQGDQQGQKEKSMHCGRSDCQTFMDCNWFNRGHKVFHWPENCKKMKRVSVFADAPAEFVGEKLLDIYAYVRIVHM